MEQVITKRRYYDIGLQIEELLYSGVFKAGERLPSERELSERFNTSRTTIREAIIMLELKGVLNVKQGSGIFFVDSTDKLSQKSLMPYSEIGPFELLQARQVIESNITGFAASQISFNEVMTESQFALLETKTGYADPCGIVCESFRQWVIEDNFVRGRPKWDKAGAMFVSNVQPYEEMKLRMLNGSHSFLAYNGSLAGYEFIWQCMEDANFRSITHQLMINEQARTLNPDLNINIQEYADLLIERFSNRNVAHRTGQIAMDGSQKLPQRALTPWLKLHQQKQNNAVLSLLVAGWLHYVIDAVEKSQSVADPMNDQFQALIKEQQDAWQQALALLHLSAIFGDLSNHQPFINEIKIAFANIKNKGIKATISQLLSDEQK